MTTKDFEIIDQVANEISPEYKATLSIEEEWVSFENTKKRIKTIIALFIVGMPMLASGFYCKSIYDKYSNQAKSIVKNVIAKEYPDATEFEFELDEGDFVENGINYEFEYQKNISGKEKLIVINDKQIKTLDIPKETKNNEPTND